MSTLRRLHASHPGAKLRCLSWPEWLWVQFDGISWKDSKGFEAGGLAKLHQDNEAEVFKEEAHSAVLWLNVYGIQCYSPIARTIQDADRIALPGRIARVRLNFSWRVGQFDEE
jgi:hypothetical protein